MENYIINNKTVALLKKEKQTIIYDVDKVRVINKSIKYVLNQNCIYYGSSYSGRKKCSRHILNKKYKVPIMIKDHTILLQLNSLRSKESLFLVTEKIINFEMDGEYLKITCVNNNIFKNNISKNSFEQMLVSAIKINNTFINQKSANFV